MIWLLLNFEHEALQCEARVKNQDATNTRSEILPMQDCSCDAVLSNGWRAQGGIEALRCQHCRPMSIRISPRRAKLALPYGMRNEPIPLCQERCRI